MPALWPLPQLESVRARDDIGVISGRKEPTVESESTQIDRNPLAEMGGPVPILRLQRRRWHLPACATEVEGDDGKD
jgi:hypothetical protein